MFTLMTIAQDDMTEQQRERLTSHLPIRGIPLQNYTFDLIRTAPPANKRPFWPKSTESWKAVLATGQQMKKQVKKVLFMSLMISFLVHDEVSDAWIARRF
jgi:hypothetical protein